MRSANHHYWMLLQAVTVTLLGVGCAGPWRAVQPGFSTNTTAGYAHDSPGSSDAAPIIRHQSVGAGGYPRNESTPGSGDQLRYPMATSGQTPPANQAAHDPDQRSSSIQLAQFNDPAVQQSGQNAWGPYAPRPPGSSSAGAYSPYPNGSAPPSYPPPANSLTPQTGDPYGSPAPNAPPTGPAYSAAPSTAPPPNYGPTPPGSSFPVFSAPNNLGPPAGPPPTGGIMGVPSPLADIFVNVQETQTGRFMLGASVNSDAGVTGQIVIDERNFDWRRLPTSMDDFINGTAFRGAGQGFRLEAMPGDRVQRYMMQFTEPYLFNTRISFNASGYLFDRQFVDWNEQRFGGRLGLGYRITPDLSMSGSFRGERVTIFDPRVNTVPQLNDVIGDNDVYSGRVNLIQDTRDIPFQPTQGYYLELAFEQVFGTFDYSRGEIDYRRYFLLAERPDGSGRHVLGFSSKVGISGSDTPIFENYFAGGFATLRGFDFRRASPLVDTVTVGGRFELLGSVEYLFPITADDMLKGVAFVDYGTVEEDVEVNSEDYRVAVGLGLRVFVPAMGPAPIALDFAVPIAREETDRIRQFSFFVGVSR